MQQEDSDNKSVESDIAALSNLALRHYQEGDLQQAQDTCNRILRKQQRPDAILILGKIAHEQRKFKAAIERYQQFLELIPDHAQTQISMDNHIFRIDFDRQLVVLNGTLNTALFLKH